MNDKQDYSDAILLLLCLIILGMYALWEYKFDWFVAVWYVIKAPTYNMVALLPEEVIKKAYFWVFWRDAFPTEVIEIAKVFKNGTYETFTDIDTFNSYLEAGYNFTLKEFMYLVNKLTIILLLPLCIPFFMVLKKKIIKKERFNKTYSIESLGIQESQIWPQIRPVIYEYHAFVNTRDLDAGWFAMSAKPAQFFHKNKLLEEFTNEDKDDLENFGKKYLKINVKKMYLFYAKSLGKKWTNVDNLSFEKRAILSIILPKLLRDPKTSKRMNDNLAIMHSSLPKKVKFSFFTFLKKLFSLKPKKAFEYKQKVKDDNRQRILILKEIKMITKIVNKDINNILNKYFPKDVYKKSLLGKKKLIKKAEINPMIQDALDGHFYETTVFAALLENARSTGVLATCEFIWLKKLNRELWYMLSQTGRTACFVECAGSWSHYMTEKKVGSKLCSPMVMNTIHAADKYMFYTHENYAPINKYDET